MTNLCPTRSCVVWSPLACMIKLTLELKRKARRKRLSPLCTTCMRTGTGKQAGLHTVGQTGMQVGSGVGHTVGMLGGQTGISKLWQTKMRQSFKRLATTIASTVVWKRRARLKRVSPVRTT